jgi:hypothetical protein
MMYLEGADDEHINRDHPEMDRTDEQIRERVAADADADAGQPVA